MEKKKFQFFTHFKAEDSDSDKLEIKGLASTFGMNPDRQGDIVDPHAFDNTIKAYMANNPIVLCDHSSMCDSAIGSVVSAVITTKGLEIVARISNAADEYTQSIRTKLKEGILRTFSIGGWFHYEGNLIKAVDLFEISIVPVPANADATFSMKSFDECLNDATIDLKAVKTQTQGNPAQGSTTSGLKAMADLLITKANEINLSERMVANLRKIKES